MANNDGMWVFLVGGLAVYVSYKLLSYEYRELQRCAAKIESDRQAQLIADEEEAKMALLQEAANANIDVCFECGIIKPVRCRECGDCLHEEQREYTWSECWHCEMIRKQNED